MPRKCRGLNTVKIKFKFVSFIYYSKAKHWAFFVTEWFIVVSHITYCSFQ